MYMSACFNGNDVKCIKISGRNVRINKYRVNVQVQGRQCSVDLIRSTGSDFFHYVSTLSSSVIVRKASRLYNVYTHAHGPRHTTQGEKSPSMETPSKTCTLKIQSHFDRKDCVTAIFTIIYGGKCVFSLTRNVQITPLWKQVT